MEKIVSYFKEPKTHRSLYVLLLIATPFLLLQNYLQSTIGMLSDVSFSIYEIEIPYVLFIASVIVIIILVVFRRSITVFNLLAWLFVLFLFWIGQQSTDYYFNHKFYELQYNWHYFAYGIFAALNYRVLKTKQLPAQKIILYTFFYAMGISAFDEWVQIPLSNRVFDVGDISKDLWGTMIGLFILFIIIENAQIFRNSKPYRQVSWKNYSEEPKTVFILAFIFAYIFMVIASLLTDSNYLLQSIVIPFILFGFVFFIIHVSQNKGWRIVLMVIFITLSGIQLIAVSKYWKDNIIYCGDYLLVYKGIPLPYFDALIYPNGLFRAVDKKTNFSTRDQQTIKTFVQDILIIGTGKGLKSGVGFPKDELTQFIYNQYQNKGLQVIMIENDRACLKYNQLAKEGKRPTLILHHD